MVSVEWTLLVALAVASGLTLAYWSAVLYHVIRTVVKIPTARRGLGLRLDAGAAPRVCVVVPAHNEEACIGEIARTLARQDYPADRLACVFVLDRCTDRTRAVLEEAWKAADRGAGAAMTILELADCPPGWVGKSHAVWSGAMSTDAGRGAEVLLFVDADTSLHSGLVRAAAALMRERGVQMLSLLSTLTHRHWFEKLVQPAASMELLRQYPVVRANDASRPRAFANGQFIMITRSAYETIGGHEALKDAVLEDVELARRCAWYNLPAALLLADGLLHCRMYETFDSFRRGWMRIYGEAANRKPERLRRMALRVRLTGTVLPVLALAAIGAGLARADGPHAGAAWICAALGAAGVSAMAGAVATAYVLGRTPLWCVPGFAVGSWLVGGIMRRAADDLEAGRPTVWGGREYARSAR